MSKKKPSKPIPEWAKSRIYVDEPNLIWFDDTPIDGSAWIRAEKQKGGVIVNSNHAYRSFPLHPEHARMLGMRLIQWAKELEKGR